MNIPRLNPKISGICMLIIFPFLCMQIIPAILFNSGINMVVSSILSAFMTSVCSLALSCKMVSERISSDIPKPVLIFGYVFMTVAFMAVDQTIFIWIGNYVFDPGMAVRAASIEGAAVNQYLMLYFIYAVFVAPISEECLFRIFLYRYLKQSFSWMTALVMSSVMFGMIHMTIAHLVTATLFGMLLTLIMEQTGCIWITIICHIAYNLATLFVSGNEMAPLAENTVLTVLVFIATVFLLAIWMLKQDACKKTE